MKRSEISRRPSKAKQAFDAEYAAVLPSVLARGCEFWAYANASEAEFVLAPLMCEGRQVGHHAAGRKVADANDPMNLRCLCDGHHRYVHAHSRWSREVGLMLSRIS